MKRPENSACLPASHLPHPFPSKPRERRRTRSYKKPSQERSEEEEEEREGGGEGAGGGRSRYIPKTLRAAPSEGLGGAEGRVGPLAELGFASSGLTSSLERPQETFQWLGEKGRSRTAVLS